MKDKKESNRILMEQYSLKEIFIKQAQAAPDDIALIFNKTTITYGELDQSSNRLAHYLLVQGVKKGDLLGLSLDRSDQLIIAMLATVKIGCIYVPIDSNYPQERIEFMIRDSRISILLTTSNTYAQMPYVQQATILLDQEAEWISSLKDTTPNIRVFPHDVAYIMYTSGSTGTPKGVAVPHQGIVRLVKETNYIQIDEHQTVGHFAAISFDASTFEIWGALLNGARLAISQPGPITPESVGEVVRTCKVSVLLLTVGLFNLMIEERIEDLVGVHYLLCGGDVMLPHIAEKAVHTLQNTHILNGYGPTENCVFSTTFEVTANHDFKSSIPIGKVIHGTTAFIVNEQMNQVDDGQPGELLVGGKGLAKGYWNREDLTKEKFVSLNGEVFYKTGDLVRELPDGNIDYLGRIDQQVKIRGFRIELDEIENIIMKKGDIKSCSVLVNESTPGDKRIVSYIVPIDGTSFSIGQLKDYLKQKMPEYMLPSNYVLMERLPLTNNGKVDRKAMAVTQFTRPDFGITYKAPQTDKEQTLVRLWQEILHVDKIGMDDHFFDLGGNSILAARATIRMKEVLQTNLPASVLYEHPTIRHLTRFTHQQSVEGHMDTLNLAAEVQLDQKIRPPSESPTAVFRHDAIFLTGATGFLGAFLIKEFLDDHPNVAIYCLVRSASVEEGLRRIKKNMEKYTIWKEAYAPKIKPIVGHLDKPMFNLTREAFHQLAETIDVIYHNGAKVNYAQTYELHKNANVTGTQTILELACTSTLKPVHYVSTISVFGPIGYFSDIKELKEDSDLDISEPYIDKDIGYAQSKWVAEKIMWEANKRGIPMTVLRPGFIMGDSHTGVNNPEDYVARMIKGCIQLGTYGHLPNQRKEFVPVDFVAKAISEICRNPSNFGKAYHLKPPPEESVDLDEFFAEINETLGYSIEKVSYNEWVRQLNQTTIQTRDNALTPFIPLLSEEKYNGKAVWELYENMPIYDSTNTQNALAESGLTCPIMDKKLMRTYFDYMQRIGFLPRQKSNV